MALALVAKKAAGLSLETNTALALAPATAPFTTLITDNFNRADTSISATGLGTSTSGHVWTSFQGSSVGQILSNKARLSGTYPFFYTDATTPNADITATVTSSAAGAEAVLLVAGDPSFINTTYLKAEVGATGDVRWHDGTVSGIASGVVPSLSAGTHTLRLRVQGSTITAWVDGVQCYSATPVGYAPPSNYTTCGFGQDDSNATSLPIDWDDLSVTIPTGAPIIASPGICTETDTAFSLDTVQYGALTRPIAWNTTGYVLKNFVTDYGGNGNGVFDNGAAIQAAMNAPSGTAIFFPAGTYAYSGWHQMVNKTNVLWYGAGHTLTIFRNTNTNGDCAFWLYQCSNINVSDMRVWCPNTTARNTHGWDFAFYLDQCAGPITFQNVYLRKIPAAGFYAWKSNGVSWYHCTVEQSFADAFHWDAGSSNGVCQFNRTIGCGDDDIASIGFPGLICNNNHVLDNLCEDGYFASGIDFQGSSNCSAKRNIIRRTGAAGIQVSCVTSYNSASCTNIDIEDNTVEGAVTRSALAGAHGAILLLTQTAGQSISGINFRRNKIINATYATEAFRLSAADATRSIAAVANDNVMTRTTGPMTSAYAISANATLTRSGNTFNGAAAP